MRYGSIADIYSGHAKVRSSLSGLAAEISADEARELVGDEKWTIEQIFEHVAIVDGGALRIVSKLLDDARPAGKPSDGVFELTDDFAQKTAGAADAKFEAPDRVRPTGGVALADSLAKLQENVAAFEALRSDLETIDSREQTFPHPYFGQLTAAEWLVIRNGHEARHTEQARRLLAEIRKIKGPDRKEGDPVGA